MGPEATVLTADEEKRRESLVERMFGASIASLEMLSVYVGVRLGLYAALAQMSRATSGELATAAGVQERYAREWLEQQAVAGILDVATESLDAADRAYRLPLGHAEVLLDAHSVNYLAPLSWSIPGLVGTLPLLLEAYRKGGGVPFPEYGSEFRSFISAINRPMFENQLGSDWFPAIPDIDARLRGDPPARVADVGCGTGWSTIAIAKAYPNAIVDGLDIDEGSIATARENLAASGVEDRVTFQTRDASDPGLAGKYDLVTAFETVHDMGNPVGALAAMKLLVSDDGAVVIADEKVAETFGAPGDEIERFNYAWSVLHCLPVGMVDPPAIGTGTVMRPETLRRYAMDAGFSAVEVLPIDHDFWRFYRLH